MSSSPRPSCWNGYFLNAVLTTRAGGGIAPVPEITFHDFMCVCVKLVHIVAQPPVDAYWKILGQCCSEWSVAYVEVRVLIFYLSINLVIFHA